MKLARVLDDEFLRVAEMEEISLEELVTEVCELVGVTARQIYNYRSGKTEIPASLLPIFCKRFRSRTLMIALEEACSEVQVEVPDDFDLNRMVTRAAQQHLRHHAQYLEAFEDGVDPVELGELRKSGDQVLRSVRQFYAIAEADCARRMALRHRK